MRRPSESIGLLPARGGLCADPQSQGRRHFWPFLLRTRNLFPGFLLVPGGAKALQQALLLPPLFKQQEIIHRVDSLFAYADRLKTRLAMAGRQVD